MKAEILANRNFVVGEIDNRIYGSFIEHLGRAVYGGIYDPNHFTADNDGFRKDVLELVKNAQVSIVRYPGGNFVSGYNWEDGTGDKSKRPQKRDLAWRSIETNEVGIDEFQKWARLADTEINMAVNLGTRGPDDARNLVEYCNCEGDTYYAKMRKNNGFEKPFGIKTWCLGNEMDGDWQMGHKTAEEYGRIAAESAKLMKRTDPEIELVVCGSSHYNMSTFGDWECTVLDHTYNHVDYISLHQYYNNVENNFADFIGRSVHMDTFIKSVAALCDAVKAKKHSPKTINLSFDEWNIWYHSNGEKRNLWQTGQPMLEDIYNFEDALLTGCILITLQNNCDRVKIACLAQLVNVIAPIITEKDGKAWAQPTYYPFMLSSVNGKGTTLKSIKKCDSYKSSEGFDIPYLECSVIDNKETGEIIVFAVNRSFDEEMKLTLNLEGYENASITEHTEIYHDNLKVVNNAENQNVLPVKREITDSKTINLKKHSWNMIKLKY